jgi:hypothetical protein
MRRLLTAFQDMQRQITQLERFMPKQIELPIVKFRDAFNEMRSFLYDLCRQWETFRGLVAMVFMKRKDLGLL